MAKMVYSNIYSNSLEEMVCSGFTRVRHYENGKIGKAHYTWNDEDCVYYHDDIDGDYYDEVPNNGEYENYKGKFKQIIELD